MRLKSTKYPQILWCGISHGAGRILPIFNTSSSFQTYEHFVKIRNFEDCRLKNLPKGVNRVFTWFYGIVWVTAVMTKQVAGKNYLEIIRSLFELQDFLIMIKVSFPQLEKHLKLHWKGFESWRSDKKTCVDSKYRSEFFFFFSSNE